MPFMINQELCAKCGGCFVKCPNRAIVQRGERYRVTEMCCDCGACTDFCSMRAIGKGKQRAVSDNRILGKALKDKLHLDRHIVAMKFADKPLKGVQVEEGPTFWCSMCGDVLEGNADPLFLTADACICGGTALMGIGARKSTKEQRAESFPVFIGEGKVYSSEEVLNKAGRHFPFFNKKYGGVIIGSFEHVYRPDMILFPVNGHQMCMLSTAYAFDTGEMIMGNSGTAACLAMTPITLLNNKPVFTCGDHGARTNMRLKNEEILVSIPFRMVSGLVKNLDRTIFAQE
jgi:uncharacterized protein (DUF169 family)/NAD-dependent dihydropyrimidine dehydrogenase PreA subunit